ncbi:NAD(P)H-binding protein [Actinophytocola sediminis]
MILITGATGTVGGEVLRLLADRGARTRAMTRDPARVRPLSESAVVRADFADPDSLRRALAEVDTVFLLTAPGAHVPEHDLAMIQAAAAEGVGKIVKLSAIGGEQSAGQHTRPADWHEPGEQALAGSGMAWSVLRPSSFASNALRWAGPIRAGQPVPNLTATGRQGVIDPRDIAAVAVEVLLTDAYDGQTHTLTGPDLVSVPDQVAVIAEEVGRQVETVDLPTDLARQQMLDAGLDPALVDVAIRGYEQIRTGGNAVLTEDAERVLGRPARSFRSWVRDHRDAFTGS